MKRYMKFIAFVAILATFIFSGMLNSIFSQQLQKKKGVAVLEFNNAGGMENSDISILTNRFRNFLVKTGVYDVIEREKMKEILKEQDFQMSDNCNTSECAVQVGKLLGVDKMIGGDIGKMGQVYTIDIRMIAVATGKIEYTESQNHKGDKEELLDVIEAIAFIVSGKAPPTKSNINLATKKETDDEVKIGNVTKKTGTLEINNDVDGVLFIDGKEIGEVTPGTLIPVENLKTGKHLIEIKKKNILYTLEVSVDHDRITKISTRDMNKLSIISDKIISFTDSRDQSVYRAILIGNTMWMLDNLKFDIPGESYSFGNDEKNCATYGKLYTWSGANKAIPEGWRLPTREDWELLISTLKTPVDSGNNRATKDFSLFVGSAGGWRTPDGLYKYLDKYPSFWSSTETDNLAAIFCNFTENVESSYLKSVSKKHAFSVRCVKTQ